MLAVTTREHDIMSCANLQKEKYGVGLDQVLALLAQSSRGDDTVAVMSSTTTTLDMKTPNDGTILHYALEKDCGSSVVKILLKNHPDACRVRDRFGNIPLHIAAYNSPLETINLLLQEYNDGIWIQNNEGALPLHFAAARNKNSAVVARLLEEDYSGSSVLTSVSTGTETPINSIVHGVGNRLPLHLAVYFNPSEEVTMLLLLANQRAGTMTDERGDYPLQLALSHCHEVAARCKCNQCHAMCAHVRPSTRSELFMHTLIASSRQSVAAYAHDGLLPLHMACLENVSQSTIQLITDMYPAAITLPCRKPDGASTHDQLRYFHAAWGSWPFHFAIHNSNSEAVKSFLKHVSWLWSEIDAQGRTSLHHLVLASTAFMKSNLTRINPDWAKVKCNAGWLPLHYACFSTNTESAYQNFLIVLAMNPNALFCGAGNDEAETPLALAARYGHLKIVRHILENCGYEWNGLEVPLMFAMRADSVKSTRYFEMLQYLCSLQLSSTSSSPSTQNLGNVSLQFLLFCRQFWTRRDAFQKQLTILRSVVACNPSAVGQIGGWERRRNAYDQFLRKTTGFLNHFSAIERNEFARTLLEAAPHVNLSTLRHTRWVSRRAAFVVRLLKSDDETLESIIVKLPEKLFRSVVMYL